MEVYVAGAAADDLEMQLIEAIWMCISQFSYFADANRNLATVPFVVVIARYDTNIMGKLFGYLQVSNTSGVVVGAGVTAPSAPEVSATKILSPHGQNKLGGGSFGFVVVFVKIHIDAVQVESRKNDTTADLENKYTSDVRIVEERRVGVTGLWLNGRLGGRFEQVVCRLAAVIP